MKPDWNDAPDWANYFVMDEDGCYYWYENKPKKASGWWYTDDGNWEQVFDNYGWEDSLEKRPE